ncbi:MAG: hypothetical protein EOP17_00455 [Rhizobiaceae bacterium]|nr:MAG: hypothetical protein EOP17_00455 [Rhizobiaceae bacterium]
MLTKTLAAVAALGLISTAAVAADGPRTSPSEVIQPKNEVTKPKNEVTKPKNEVTRPKGGETAHGGSETPSASRGR